MSLDLESVRARFPGREIRWLDSCASTMTEAARLAAEGCASGTAIGAEEQTAGQGRFGRPWHSEREAGLYFSLVLRLPPREEIVRLLAMALGLAVAEAIGRVADAPCDLRWPNDVLIGERKCAGILVQMEREVFNAGIGINVNQSAFPEDVRSVATSLRIATGKTHARERLLTSCLECADGFVAMLVEGGARPLLAAFARASSYVRGKRVAVEQGGRTIEGVTDGLDESGYLYVRRADGSRAMILAGGVRAISS